MTRKEAKAAGLKFYETGKACAQGHTSKRYTISGICTACRFPSQQSHPNRVRKYRYLYGVELSAVRPKPAACEICQNSSNKIVFDHCHQSGSFRGWICDPCNTALGLVKDDPERLRALARYLEGSLGAKLEQCHSNLGKAAIRSAGKS
jgi:hypothetical protein